MSDSLGLNTARRDAGGQSHFPDSKQWAKNMRQRFCSMMTRCRRTVAADLSEWTYKLSISCSNKIPELLLARDLLTVESGELEPRRKAPASDDWSLVTRWVTHAEVASKRLRKRRYSGPENWRSPVVFSCSNHPLQTPEEHLDKAEHKYHL